MAHEHPAFIRINASTSHCGGGGVTQALQYQTTVLADDLVNALVQAFSDGRAEASVSIRRQVAEKSALSGSLLEREKSLMQSLNRRDIHRNGSNRVQTLQAFGPRLFHRTVRWLP
jgi:hypothetical protein